MRPSIAPAPTDRAKLRELVAEAAVNAVYSRFCSSSVDQLESAVVDLIGTPLPDEDDDTPPPPLQRMAPTPTPDDTGKRGME
jgi:hypothetical protein